MNDHFAPPSNTTSISYPAYFPEGFLLGAGHAHGQVEYEVSNWSEFAKSQKRYDQLLVDGEINKYGIDNFLTGRGCEFETRFGSDFALARSQNHTAIRFGISWAKIEPKPGIFNHEELKRYRNMIIQAIMHGLEPVITLYHWTHAPWFENSGSWKRADAPKLFARFVTEVMKYVGSLRVSKFIILNEPDGVYARFSFAWGKFPPNECCDVDGPEFEHIVANLAEAHRLAHAVIKAACPQVSVGIAQSMTYLESDDPHWLKGEGRWNYSFVDRIVDYLDFIGINNYFVTSVVGGKTYHGYNKGEIPGLDYAGDTLLSDVDWAMSPRSIYGILKAVHAQYPNLPLMITEHGCAVREMYDQRRAWFTWESLKWLLKAIHEGVPVIGYLHWSLMDNYEWLYGYDKQFGLWHVDRETMERTPREFSKVYAEICMANGLTEEVARHYQSFLKKP